MPLIYWTRSKDFGNIQNWYKIKMKLKFSALKLFDFDLRIQYKVLMQTVTNFVHFA